MSNSIAINTIEEKYGTKYTKLLFRELQQTKSILEPWVTALPGCQGKSVQVDVTSKATMRRVRSAYQDVGEQDVQLYGARQMFPVPFYSAHKFTSDAALYNNVLDYRVATIIQEVKSEAVRCKDKVILGVKEDDSGVLRKATGINTPLDPYAENIGSGIFGTNYTGINGTTHEELSDSFIADLATGSVVPVDYVETGSAAATNLTLAKIKNGIARLKARHAHIPGATTPVLVVSQSQVFSLAAELGETNYDIHLYDFVNGKLNKMYGCEIVETEMLPYVTGTTTTRICPMYIKEHIYFGMWDDLNVRIDAKVQKGVNYGQVVTSCAFGSMRKYKESVIQILCEE